MLLERLHNVGEILKLVKAKKRELAEENYNTKKNEYKEVLRKAEIRTDVDFLEHYIISFNNILICFLYIRYSVLTSKRTVAGV